MQEKLEKIILSFPYRNAPDPVGIWWQSDVQSVPFPIHQLLLLHILHCLLQRKICRISWALQTYFWKSTKWRRKLFFYLKKWAKKFIVQKKYNIYSRLWNSIAYIFTKYYLAVCLKKYIFGSLRNEDVSFFSI